MTHTTDPMIETYEQQQRQRLYKLLQVANREIKKQQPTWTDEDYRNVLMFCGGTEKDGKISATTMSIAQMERALKLFREKGFKSQRPAPKVHYSADKKPRINKLNAIWCRLHDAGAVKDRSEAAMTAWCQNNVPGIQKLAWATSPQLNKAIEMLKGFARSRGVDVY